MAAEVHCDQDTCDQAFTTDSGTKASQFDLIKMDK